MFANIWKISAPKEKIKALIDEMDADLDGYISFGEVRGLLEKYAKAIKRSARYSRRR